MALSREHRIHPKRTVRGPFCPDFVRTVRRPISRASIADFGHRLIKIGFSEPQRGFRAGVAAHVGGCGSGTPCGRARPARSAPSSCGTAPVSLPRGGLSVNCPGTGLNSSQLRLNAKAGKGWFHWGESGGDGPPPALIWPVTPEVASSNVVGPPLLFARGTASRSSLLHIRRAPSSGVNRPHATMLWTR